MDALGIIVMVGQLVLALSILVGIHEFGHLIAAKMFGMRVEQFSIGFPPKVFGIKFGETEYSIGAIPLGGFVKISGMIDESLDTKNLSEEPQPWEFRSKPAWQRLIVMVGGIIMNVITGIIVFILLLYFTGESYIPKTEIDKYGIVAYELGEEIGLKTGDRIVNVNGQNYNKLSDLLSPDFILGDDPYYTVARDSEEFKVSVPIDILEKLSDRKSEKGFIDIQTPFRVGEVSHGSGGAKAGLREGDNIIAVDGQDISYYHEFLEAVKGKAKQDVDLKILREGSERPIDMTVTLSDEGKVGFISVPMLDLQTIEFTFSEAVPKGTVRAFSIVWLNIRAFGKMFKGELDPTKSVKGPIGIAQEFGSKWIWEKFWTLVGLLSMVLAFMNFLPIPALDGGHVMFLSYEMISGHKPSDKFLENAQKVGMVILLALMAFVIFNDVFQSINW